MNNCGISRWDDPQKINAQLKALTDQPIWEVTDDYYNNVILKYYDEKLSLIHISLFRERGRKSP